MKPECCMCNSPPTEPFKGKWYCHDHLLEVQERERTGGWSTKIPSEPGDYWVWIPGWRQEVLRAEVFPSDSDNPEDRYSILGLYGERISGEKYWMPAIIPDPPKLAPTLEGK